MFIFGLILLAGFFLYFTRRHIQKARWKGEKNSLRGIDFQIKTRVYGRHRHMQIRIGVAGAGEGDFLLKPENRFDRLCKSAGLVKEYQTGNPAFDNAVYMVADDIDTQQEIAASPALMEAVLALFEGAGREYSAVQALNHQRGRLWLEVRINWSASEQDLRKMARFCVPRLTAITTALQARQMPSPGRRKALSGGAIAMLQATSTALACTAGIQVMCWFLGRFVFFGQVPYTLDQAAWLRDAGLLGGVLLLALLLAGGILAGKSARAHLVLLQLLLAGGSGALGTAGVQLRYLNMEFDRTAAVDYQTQVRARRTYTGSTGTSYYIQADDWLQAGETIELYVKQSVYEQARIGAALHIRQRAGYLGYRWVESMTPAEQP